MKALLLSEARSFVHAAIDEIQLNDSEFEGVIDDNADMDSIIDSKILEAVTYIHNNAQLNKIGEDAVTAMPTTSLDGTSIKIPSKDIMRLLMFKGRDSDLSVTNWYGEDSPVAAMQNDEYAKGTYQNPVIIKRIGANPFFQYYSLAKADALGNDSIAYIPYPLISGTGNSISIDICETVKLSILNYLTGLVLLVYKDQHADSFFNQAKLYM